MRNKALTSEIARQYQADHPSEGSIDLNPALDYDTRESPAYGSDAPPEDYTDRGQGKVPAEGVTDKPSPSGNYVVPQQLGRGRPDLSELAVTSEANRQVRDQANESALHHLAQMKIRQLQGEEGQLDSARAAQELEDAMSMLGISHEWGDMEFVPESRPPR